MSYGVVSSFFYVQKSVPV